MKTVPVTQVSSIVVGVARAALTVSGTLPQSGLARARTEEGRTETRPGTSILSSVASEYVPTASAIEHRVTPSVLVVDVLANESSTCYPASSTLASSTLARKRFVEQATRRAGGFSLSTKHAMSIQSNSAEINGDKAEMAGLMRFLSRLRAERAHERI